MERASASAPQALEGIRQFVSSLVMLFGLRTVFCHCGDPLSDTGKRRSDASRRQDSKETAGREGGKEGKKKAEWFEESIGASQEIN